MTPEEWQKVVGTKFAVVLIPMVPPQYSENGRLKVHVGVVLRHDEDGTAKIATGVTDPDPKHPHVPIDWGKQPQRDLVTGFPKGQGPFHFQGFWVRSYGPAQCERLCGRLQKDEAEKLVRMWDAWEKAKAKARAAKAAAQAAAARPAIQAAPPAAISPEEAGPPSPPPPTPN